jgi:hypothetical protein
MIMALPFLAAGAGDGSGGGQGVPLGLDSSIPADGQKDVPVTGDIKLTFNKNVIFLGIRDANKTCFSLIAADGSKVPIQVIMADDQTTEGFEKRRDISVRPVQKLQPGTAYVVKVSPQLQAKNGMSLGHEVTVKFVTAGVASKPVEPETASVPVPVPVTTPAPISALVTDIGKNLDEPKQPAPVPADATAITSKSSDPVVEKVQLAEQPVQQPLEEKKTPVEDKSSTTKLEESERKSNLPIALAAGAVIIVALGYTFNRIRS